jgi:hypothetical protein
VAKTDEKKNVADYRKAVKGICPLRTIVTKKRISTNESSSGCLMILYGLLPKEGRLSGI